MYLDHWSLKRVPFAAPPDSRFWFSTAAHDNALAAATYAVCDGHEPVLLTGPSGCGKTLVLRALRRQLPRERYLVAFVPELAGGQVGLLRRLAYHLTHELAADDAAAMDAVWQTAHDAERQQRGVVVMLDDWPRGATVGDFEALSWLLNLDLDRGQVGVLFTADVLDPLKEWPDWLVQRLLARLQLAAFKAHEVAEYLRHRLRTAGHPTGDVFTTEAADRIAAWSGGNPRRINRAAHLALQIGYLDLASRVDADMLERALQRLMPQSASRFVQKATPDPASMGADP